MSIFPLSHSFIILLNSDLVVPVFADATSIKTSETNHVLCAAASLINPDTCAAKLSICALWLVLTRAYIPTA